MVTVTSQDRSRYREKGGESGPLIALTCSMAKPILASRSGKRPNSANARAGAALVLIVIIAVSFWQTVHYWQSHIHRSPHMILLFPATGLLALLLVTPLVLFLAHQSDFGHLNPLYPPHYLQMAKTSLRAVANNNWKVSSKDL